MGRFSRWIEQDPERAPIWRYAWDLLLEDRFTLEEIAEALHARGYRRQSGRPFVSITPSGKRKCHISTLSNTFHNWAYAGWVVSTENCLPPKSLQGTWEPIVTTVEFERGLSILAKRTAHRIVRRKHAYLLKGLIYYEATNGNKLVKLTGSTSNAGRSGGGTAYYCIPRSDINFLCCKIDEQISLELMGIQVKSDLIPSIRDAYTRDLAAQFGHLRPDEREQLEAALKSVDEEEERALRLYAAGKITEAIWDGLWREWQERRRALCANLENLEAKQEVHIDNLDTALRFITKVGSLYNSLTCGDQKELLRQLVERVVVNPEGKIRLELRTPFAYLKELSDQVGAEGSEDGAGLSKTKTNGQNPVGQCSDWLQVC